LKAKRFFFDTRPKEKGYAKRNPSRAAFKGKASKSQRTITQNWLQS